MLSTYRRLIFNHAHLWWISAKLHYTDTGYGHVVQRHRRTSSQQFYNLLYNKFATSQCQSPTSRHVQILGCGKFLSVGGEFVVQQVELLWARPLVVLYNMSVAGIRVVEFGTYSVLKQRWRLTGLFLGDGRPWSSLINSTFDLLMSNTDPDPDSGTLYPDRYRDRHQNLINLSLDHVARLQNNSSFITYWDTLQNVSLRRIS